MKDLIEIMRQMQEQQERIRDPLGLSRMSQLAIGRHPMLSVSENLSRVMGAQMRLSDPYRGMLRGLELYKSNTLLLDTARMFDVVRSHRAESSLARIIEDASRIVGSKAWQFGELFASIQSMDAVSVSFTKQLEIGARLNQQMRNLMPSCREAWWQDWTRNPTWLTAHGALLPQTPVIVRIVDSSEENSVVSWLREDDDNDVNVAIAAMTEHELDGDAEIIVKGIVRCAFCRTEIFTRKPRLTWIGDTLTLDMEAVLVCNTCCRREEENPGAFENALQEFIESETEESRPRFGCMSGENTSPVPCGVLHAVKDSHGDDSDDE